MMADGLKHSSTGSNFISWESRDFYSSTFLQKSNLKDFALLIVDLILSYEQNTIIKKLHSCNFLFICSWSRKKALHTYH